MIRGAFGNGYKGAQSVSEITLVLGSASVALVQLLAPVAWGRPQQDFGRCGDNIPPTTVAPWQNCFSGKFWEAPAFARMCSWQDSGPWECKASITQKTRNRSLHLTPTPAVSIAAVHEEEKPTIDVFLVAFWCVTLQSYEGFHWGFWHFQKKEGEENEKERKRKHCLVSLSNVCLPFLKYRLTLTKLTQAGFSLWWFQFRAYASQMIVIQQDFVRPG